MANHNILVTTVSGDVVLNELGYKIVHPAVDFDLTVHIPIGKLNKSTDFQHALDNGTLIAKNADGETLNVLHPSAIACKLEQKIDLTEKGANNGVATLDGSGKVPSSQLPAANGALNYIGVWNADTNTPALSDSGGGGVKGDYYKVSVTGSTSVDGETGWTAGDWIVHNGTIWEKSDHTDSVDSVNGKIGSVVLDTGDLTEVADKKFVTDAEKTVLSNTSGNNSGDESPATTTTAGIVERATQTETNTGTDDSRYVSPAKLKNSSQWATKEDAFAKNSAFNKNFGTAAGTVLEGNTTTITTQQANDIAANNSKVSFPEAPNDGQEYVRKSEGWALASAGGGDPTAQILESVITDTTASSVDVLAAGRTITPASGNYLVTVSGIMSNDVNNGGTFVSIYSGGVRQNATERKHTNTGGQMIGAEFGFSSQTIVSVNGSQAIELKWKTGGSGISTIYNPTLTIIKVA